MRFGYCLQYGLEQLINQRRLRRWQKLERRKCLSTRRAWFEDIVWVLLAVLVLQQYLFQLYIIPSGSMENTMLIGDRVAVDKLSYGPELLPNWRKLAPLKQVERASIIAFVSPDGPAPGPVYGIAQKIVFLLSLSLIDLDRYRKVALEQGPWRSLRPNYSPTSKAFQAQFLQQPLQELTGATPLLVKRAVGFSGDTLRFINGDLWLRPSGWQQFITEKKFKNLAQLNYQQKRLPEQDGKESFYRKRVRYSYYLNPQDAFISQRFWHEVLGYYVPNGYVLPLGDNRDNSHDGRWFGLVAQDRLIGKILLRFWPLSRLSWLH